MQNYKKEINTYMPLLSENKSIILIAVSLYKLMTLCACPHACMHYSSIIVLSDGLYYLVEIILS